MGAFQAQVQSLHGAADLGPLSSHDDGHFDWVLDFTAPAPDRLPAPGHYPLAEDDFPAFKAALLEIAVRLREGYEKPRYFHLDETLCAHRRQGVAGCSACLDACPAGAITSGDAAIRIEPFLCQGCGTCAQVCPSGAVRLEAPTAALALDRLQPRLSAGESPYLWLGTDTAPPGWLAEPDGAGLGLEFWLAALASGCTRVAVQTRDARVQADLMAGRALLEGLGLAPALGTTEAAETLPCLPGLPGSRKAIPVAPEGSNAKRTLMFSALEALIALAPAPPAIVPLPPAPLGDVRIAAERCTLCGVCVRLCPAEALSFPGSVTQIALTEERCLQCGLCVQGCPEQAITLTPRLLTSSAARRSPRVVAEADLFACTGCGKPFAPRALIERSRALMADNPMFQGAQARLMTLCPDCRQREMAGA